MRKRSISNAEKAVEAHASSRMRHAVEGDKALREATAGDAVRKTGPGLSKHAPGTRR